MDRRKVLSMIGMSAVGLALLSKTANANPALTRFVVNPSITQGEKHGHERNTRRRNPIL